MSLRVLDIFAGCGGFSSGLRDAGLDIVAAIEIDKWAADTYRVNHPGVNVLVQDIHDISTAYLANAFKGEVDLVAAGPPCQGFSVSGSRQYGNVNRKNDLVLEALRVVAAVQPRYILIENVAGFQTGKLSRDRSVLAYVIRKLAALGYDSRVAILQAADFGVPSLRSRVFIFGVLKPFAMVATLRPTHGPERTLLVARHLSVLEAIGDLPKLAAGEGSEDLVRYTKSARNDFQARMRGASSGVRNHVAMKHTARLVERFSAMKQGDSGYQLGRSLTGKAVTSYKSNNQRLVGSLPSLCITANFQSNFVHPVQHRNLTAREAARLMTFPDQYVFQGKRTLMSSTLLRAEGRSGENYLSQYNQIGNSVPPLLAQRIGEAVMSSYQIPNAKHFALASIGS